MITQKEINDILARNHMTNLTISTYPTWMDKNRQEGIEFRAGKVISFWNKDGQRVYDQPASEHIVEIQKIIEGGKDEKSAKTEDKKDEPKPDEKNTVVNQKETVAELPDFLTSALMSKWAKMSTTDRILLFQKTPTDKIKQVKVGKNEFGKDVFAPYVEGNYMFREANAAFLFDWYLSGAVITVCPTGVSVVGTLHCWFSEYQKYLSRPATGYQELNKKVDTEMAKKGATTDAIKKGLSLFGFNSDVYSGEV